MKLSIGQLSWSSSVGQESMACQRTDNMLINGYGSRSSLTKACAKNLTKWRCGLCEHLSNNNQTLQYKWPSRTGKHWSWVAWIQRDKDVDQVDQNTRCWLLRIFKYYSSLSFDAKCLSFPIQRWADCLWTWELYKSLRWISIAKSLLRSRRDCQIEKRYRWFYWSLLWRFVFVIEVRAHQ